MSDFYDRFADLTEQQALELNQKAKETCEEDS